jgi:hypothetical protein
MQTTKSGTLPNRCTWLVSSRPLFGCMALIFSFLNSIGQPILEYQGGAFDPWNGPGYGACYKLINEQVSISFFFYP